MELLENEKSQSKKVVPEIIGVSDKNQIEKITLLMNLNAFKECKTKKEKSNFLVDLCTKDILALREIRLLELLEILNPDENEQVAELMEDLLLLNDQTYKGVLTIEADELYFSDKE